MLNRRRFLISSFVFTIGTINPTKCLAAFEIAYSEKTWRKLLTPAQFAILRKWKTERPFSNSLYGEKSDLLRLLVMTYMVKNLIYYFMNLKLNMIVVRVGLVFGL